MIHGRTLLSMDMPSIHGWWISMSGMQHIFVVLKVHTFASNFGGAKTLWVSGGIWFLARA